MASGYRCLTWRYCRISGVRSGSILILGVLAPRHRRASDRNPLRGAEPVQFLLREMEGGAGPSQLHAPLDPGGGQQESPDQKAGAERAQNRVIDGRRRRGRAEVVQDRFFLAVLEEEGDRQRDEDDHEDEADHWRSSLPGAARRPRLPRNWPPRRVALGHRRALTHGG